MSMMRRRRISESRFMRIRIHQRINMNATVDFLKTLHELQRTSEFKSMKIRISSKNDILQCYCQFFRNLHELQKSSLILEDVQF